MSATGYMALLAKNIGIVSIWPRPMNRSQVLTMHAMISENVEKSEAPSPMSRMAAATSSGCRLSRTPKAVAQR